MDQYILQQMKNEVLYLRDRVSNLMKLLKEVSDKPKEFTFTDVSLSLNNYIDEYIDKYSPRGFDSDELGQIDYDKENNSINVYFDINDSKIQKIIREGIESFICEWEKNILQEIKSSTEEV